MSEAFAAPEVPKTLLEQLEEILASLSMDLIQREADRRSPALRRPREAGKDDL
jgi:hypothetical protein